jgi:TPR repeat protein
MLEGMMRIGIFSLVVLSIGCMPRENREMPDRAQSGDPQAMYEWGKYRKRQGLQSYEAWDEAMRWCERAAERGNTSAMVTMGSLFLPSSQPDDCRQGYCWFARAARAGDMEAQNQMHRIYQFGEYAREGFTKDSGVP